ncbi:MAG: extracellular solute-binding protein [Alphaproteobacteria bacterium]
MKTFKILSLSLLASTAFTSHAAENSIDVWAWNINVPVVEKAAEMYKQNHPDVMINVLDISSQDVYVKMSTGLQARGAGLGDVILLEDTNLRGYLENWPNGFVNLSKLGFTAEGYPDFKKSVNTLNGDLYGIPFDAGPVGLFYRPSVFEKAGVDPKSIETWDDYIEAGKIIFEKTGSYMTEVRSDDDFVIRSMMGAFPNTHYFDHEGNIAFMSPEMLEVFKLVEKMDDAGILYKGAKGWDGYVQAIVNTRIVATPCGAWLAGTIEQQAPDQAGDWGVLPLPKNSQGKNASNIGGSNFVIPSSSDNIDLAADFMKFFASNATVQEDAFKTGLFPTYTPVYASESFNAPVAYFNNQAIWAEFAKVVKDIPAVNFTMDYALAREEVMKALSDVVFKDVEPQKALSDAAKRLANQTGRKVNKY